jgi:hypothetical protein
VSDKEFLGPCNDACVTMSCALRIEGTVISFEVLRHDQIKNKLAIVFLKSVHIYALLVTEDLGRASL